MDVRTSANFIHLTAIRSQREMFKFVAETIYSNDVLDRRQVTPFIRSNVVSARVSQVMRNAVELRNDINSLF